MQNRGEEGLQKKLHILADAAKYDVACTSSGVSRRGQKGFLGNSCASGICHSFASDGRCISLLKVLQTNHCIYDCKYCLNRTSNDVERTSFTPEELCSLTIEFYKRNYIEGLFLSSGVDRSPAYTMEQMCRSLRLLRSRYHFRGYIHVKAVPGAPEELLTEAGYLADRMSINLELPTAEGMKRLAPNKNHTAILRPMGMVARTIAAHRLALGKDERMERSRGNLYLENSIFSPEQQKKVSVQTPALRQESGTKELYLPADLKKSTEGRSFAAAGQSTQMIIGAAPESDYQLVTIAEALYKNYNLKRVFYSAFVNVNNDSSLPSTEDGPPLLREHRLYQADWLLRFYGFSADELLSESHPNFNSYIDPKCDWALQHLGEFPVEINKAAKAQLLRIPGVGPRSVERILRARRSTSLDFKDIARMGVVMKRARYFITCNGRTDDLFRQDEDYIVSQLMGAERRHALQISQSGLYRQLSLFDDNNENYAPLTASSR